MPTPEGKSLPPDDRLSQPQRRNWAAIHGAFIAMVSAVGMANCKLSNLLADAFEFAELGTVVDVVVHPWLPPQRGRVPPGVSAERGPGAATITPS